MTTQSSGREVQLQAVYEFFGGWSSLSNTPLNIGGQSITVFDTPPLNLNSIKIDQGNDSEGALVKSVTGSGPYTINLVKPLQKDHEVNAIVTTYTTLNPSAFPAIKTLVMGEPMNKMQAIMPLMWITVPNSHEHRDGAASTFKFVDYTIRVGLMWKDVGQQQSGADRGASLLGDFYQLLDEIADTIRTNKQLITNSYPGGASTRFGEDFRIQEEHGVEGQMLIIGADITISSEETIVA